jgi:hypothetical protein
MSNFKEDFSEKFNDSKNSSRKSKEAAHTGLFRQTISEAENQLRMGQVRTALEQYEEGKSI